MTHFSIKLAAVTTLMFLLLALGAELLGKSLPPIPILNGFTEGCETITQPCWNGIVPGLTSVSDARERIESKGYHLFNIANGNLYFTNRVNGVTPEATCSNVRVSVVGDDQPITSIVFTGCQGLLVGDTTFLGLPEKILGSYIKLGDYVSTEMVEYEYIDDVFQFREWSPFSKGTSLYVGSSTFGIHKTIASRGFQWHGFVPRWRFCQLEPTFSDCPK